MRDAKREASSFRQKGKCLLLDCTLNLPQTFSQPDKFVIITPFLLSYPFKIVFTGLSFSVSSWFLFCAVSCPGPVTSCFRRHDVFTLSQMMPHWNIYQKRCFPASEEKITKADKSTFYQHVTNTFAVMLLYVSFFRETLGLQNGSKIFWILFLD